MTPDPASTSRDGLGGLHEQRVSLEEGLRPARGLVVGMLLGLAFWVGVIVAAWAVGFLA